MSTIAIYDSDYMNYENVIPNLECAKICTYYNNMHQIALLVPTMDPGKYSKFIYRKEYDDGVYPIELTLPNVEYGGRAFSNNKYIALPPQMEKTIPNMHLYDPYIEKYGKDKNEIMQIKHILNCAHVRLSKDGVNCKSLNQLESILSTGKYSGLIFHDYNLGEIEGAYQRIYEFSQTRHYVGKDKIREYPIGNKYPIMVNSSDDLEKWLKINVMANLFFIQYNGIITNVMLNELCEKNKRMAIQMYYNILPVEINEDLFFNQYAEEIFKQVLFLRRSHIKILLIYDNQKMVSKELKIFIDLMNCWLSSRYRENFLPARQSLYTYCLNYKKYKYEWLGFRFVNLDINEIRDLFQFVRVKNYNLFKLFYECDSVILKGDEFINEWARD